MWLTNLKIAIVQKDSIALSRLLDDVPQLDAKEASSAIYLLKEATQVMRTLKTQLQ